MKNAMEKFDYLGKSGYIRNPEVTKDLTSEDIKFYEELTSSFEVSIYKQIRFLTPF